MEKYRYYVDLPGDLWEDGTFMDLIRVNAAPLVRAPATCGESPGYCVKKAICGASGCLGASGLLGSCGKRRGRQEMKSEPRFSAGVS